jgi:peptide/nickel transport system permease protein
LRVRREAFLFRFLLVGNVLLLRYAAKRLLLAVPLLLGISVLTFGLLHLTPGNPVQAESAMNPKVSPESIRALRTLYGLDDPLPLQYWRWLKRLARLDFGRSFRDQRPVLDKLADALPATLLLNILSLFLVLSIGIPLGVRAATHPDAGLTRLFGAFTFAAFSFPEFWLALLLQLGLAVWLGILPISGYMDPALAGAPWWRQLPDILWHAIAPLIVSTFGAWAVLSRYVRNSMLEVLHQDYIRTARAKGLSERRVFWRHALPNALLPVITLLGLSLPALVSGSVIIETIFAWPGMGRLAWEAATGYDYPVVMGVSVMGALLTILGNLAADLGLALLDPRIKVR